LEAVGLRNRVDAVEVRWGLWGCGAELMFGDTLGAVRLRNRVDAGEIRWGLWGCGLELLWGDTWGAVRLRSRANVWRYVGGCGAADQT
jgi:hypothetical protein